MTRRPSRDLLPLTGELLPAEDVPVARPVLREHTLATPSASPVVVYVQPASVAEPTPERPFVPVWLKLLGYFLALAATIAAVISLVGPPHIVKVHRGPAPDLVRPSR